MNTEPLPLLKYLHPLNHTQRNIGFSDMIINPQSTHLYGSGINNVIYCYVLDSTERSIYFSGPIYYNLIILCSVVISSKYIF